MLWTAYIAHEREKQEGTPGTSSGPAGAGVAALVSETSTGAPMEVQTWNLAKAAPRADGAGRMFLLSDICTFPTADMLKVSTSQLAAASCSC